MGFISEELELGKPTRNRVEALKTLTKLLMQEVEVLVEITNVRKPISTKKINLNVQVQRYEANLICDALISANGNQRKAAEMLGMKATTLHAKIKRYEIDTFRVTGQSSFEDTLEEKVLELDNI